MTKVRVHIVNASRLWRESLTRVLDPAAFEVFEESEGTLTAARREPETVPAIIVYRLAGSLELAAGWISEMRRLRPQTHVVVLASELRPDHLMRTIQAGADGFLLEDISGEELGQSLRRVAAGERVFPTVFSEFSEAKPAEEMPMRRRSLSAREIDILRHLLRGNSNKAIANQLNISEATVKVHVKALLRKIPASNRTQAAMWAVQNGIGMEDMPHPAGRIVPFRAHGATA